MHEDWESSGFYAYAIIPLELKSILDKIYRAVKKVSPINLSEEIEGVKAKGGFILHDRNTFDETLKNWLDWPEAFILIKNQLNPLHFTFETASEQPIEQRVHTQCVAIKTVVKAVEKIYRNK